MLPVAPGRPVRRTSAPGISLRRVRKASTNRIAAVAALLLAGCGSGGGGAGEGGTAEAPDVPFSFEYPGGFKRVTHSGNTLLEVELDRANGIVVHKVSDRTDLVHSTAVVRAIRRREAVNVKPFRNERHSGRNMRVLESTFSRNPTLHTVEYFFVASGKTWDFECESYPDKQRQVSEACNTAVESIKDRRPD
jgi:hypothetical protein